MRRCAIMAKQYNRTHIVGECDFFQEARYVLEMRKPDECDMEKFSTPENKSTDRRL